MSVTAENTVEIITTDDASSSTESSTSNSDSGSESQQDPLLVGDSGSETHSSQPEDKWAKVVDEMNACENDEYYAENYERAFELFYMYCQLESGAAAHFAQIAACAVAWRGYAPSESALVTATSQQLRAQRYMSTEWDPELPAEVRAQLEDADNHLSDKTVLEEWMHRDWETAPGPAYAPNFEHAFSFFYLALDLDAEAAAHFAQRVASDYADCGAMRLPRDDPACGLCDALMDDYEEAGGVWDEFLPADVLQELEEECTSNEDRRAVLEDWLALPDGDDQGNDGDDEPETTSAKYNENYAAVFEVCYHTLVMTGKDAAHCAQLVADVYGDDEDVETISDDSVVAWLVDCLLDAHEDTDVWDAMLPADLQSELYACADADACAALLVRWFAVPDDESGEDDDSSYSNNEDDTQVELEMKVADGTMKELTASIYCVAYAVIVVGLVAAVSNLAPVPYCY